MVADQIVGINYRHFEAVESGKILAYGEDGHTTCPFIDLLSVISTTNNLYEIEFSLTRDEYE